MALSFDAGNYFALMVLGLTLAIVLAGGSLLKALSMLIIGVVMALVGADPLTAEPRLTFGSAVLYDGRSEEHTSELQSLMRISYAVFCLKKKKQNPITKTL